MSVKQKLVEALTEAGAPPKMIDAAAQGRYADFESESATPIMDLVHDCQLNGLSDIARRAMDGDFDGE